MFSNHIRPLIVLLAAALFMLQCTKGDDEKKDDEKPDANYTGKLLLTYARDFPDFYATVSIDVDVYESGDVLFSSPSQVPYHGVEEKPVGDTKVKIDETGTITVTSLSGTWKKIDGVAYLEVSSNTLIDGTSQVWTWVDNSWYQVLNEPFTLENPVDPPFLFSVTDANLGAGSSVGGTAVGDYGSATFTWTLTLLVSLVP
jgi:hypothetical protein